MPSGSFNDGSSIDAYDYNYAWAFVLVVYSQICWTRLCSLINISVVVKR